MEFLDLPQAQEKLITFFSKEKKTSPSQIRVIASPYRICPLGAHIDHQGGPVLGMTINAYTLLAFVPSADGAVRLQSRNYPGIIQFELKRVNDGVVAWRRGRIEAFGRLMVESCRSSIESYECGIQPIYDLQQIVSSAGGVVGSRFMGGGFGGCVVGLVKHSKAATAAEDIHKAYRQLHPEVADQAAVYLARSADGVRFL